MLGLFIRWINTPRWYPWCIAASYWLMSYLTLLLFMSANCIVICVDLWLNLQLSSSTIFSVRWHHTQKSSSPWSDSGFEHSWNTPGCLCLCTAAHVVASCHKSSYLSSSNYRSSYVDKRYFEANHCLFTQYQLINNRQVNKTRLVPSHWITRRSINNQCWQKS